MQASHGSFHQLCLEGVRFASPWMGQFKGPHPAKKFTGLPPGHLLFSSFTINAHRISFPTSRSCPVCIHFSRANDSESRCGLAVTTLLTIYSAKTEVEPTTAVHIWKNTVFLLIKLLSHRSLSSTRRFDPKMFVHASDDSRESVNTAFGIVWCACLQGEGWSQTHDADKNFFLCYSNKKYIHTEI